MSASCGGSSTIENPTGAEFGAVRIAINLNTFNPNAPMPGAFGSGGACFARHQGFGGTNNVLSKTTSSSPLPLVLNRDITKQERGEALLQIQVIGGSGSFQEFTFANSDISVDAAGVSTVPILAPIDQSSTIKVRLVDVCCDFNSRRLEWTSLMGDQALLLSSSVPKTQTDINAGQAIVTRTATLLPFGLLSCQ